MKQQTIDRIRKFSEDRDWDQFHSPANLAKSISIEANELLECFQWDETNFDINAVKEELADVMVYCRNMLDKLGLDEDEIINEKMTKNEAKYPVEKAKGRSDKYDKLQKEETKPADEKKTRLYRTHLCILCEMGNYPYKGTEIEKSLAKDVKKFLLDEMNSHTKAGAGKFYDPIFACSKMPFHGHYLSWHKGTWKRSAEVVYNYYKAEELIKCIRKYEGIVSKTIIHDYSGLLEYFYNAISKNEEIDFWKGPGIDAAFECVPEETLNNRLRQFKELYE